MTTASVVIRTYNESRYLGQLLASIRNQVFPGGSVEIVLVDSGSTDDTVAIGQAFDVRLVRIAQADFTFGRSLNVGCEAASGDLLVFISGHCIPVGVDWLQNLVRPILAAQAVYSYGKQVGNEDSYFSERQLFRKYFPDHSMVPQTGFFANNANSALLASTWRELRFDEQLTGLEDMDLAKKISGRQLGIAYCADAPVYHLHDESWGKIRLRYEREAIALQRIMPEVQLSFGDFLRYFTSACLLDFGAALQERKLHRVAGEIVMFRLMQFWGAYRGNHVHRVISRDMKNRYFYPR
ncbi:MAG: glycosyltransferase family 2 protein [Steroidobacteraceae bacterium]